MCHWVTAGLVMEITSLLRGLCDSYWVGCRCRGSLLVQLGVIQLSHPNRKLIIKRRRMYHKYHQYCNPLIFPVSYSEYSPPTQSSKFFPFFWSDLEIWGFVQTYQVSSECNFFPCSCSLSADGQNVKEQKEEDEEEAKEAGRAAGEEDQGDGGRSNTWRRGRWGRGGDDDNRDHWGHDFLSHPFHICHPARHL